MPLHSTVEQQSITTIRTLAMDAVQAANSGHPGTPMALAPGGKPDVLLLASGSEVALCVTAHEQLKAEGIKARVISMPSWELFEQQSQTYKDSVIPPDVTSNPTIFEKAIAGSDDYDDDLRRLLAAGTSIEAIYEALVLDDIARAADLLRPLYDATNGLDGYVSLEVSPTLAHNTDGTVAEARRLFAALGRPNVMIKVPATPAGIPAIQTLIGAGMNINVTLIFSPAQYEAVAAAYLAGLETLAARGGDLCTVGSVASFFISRVDTAVDRMLKTLDANDLLGKTAIANAKVAYARFRELFSDPRWERLGARGARAQRPLWASTGTKDPHLPDTLYVDALIGPDTVNTVPPATFHAFVEHGTVAATLHSGLAEARGHLAKLAELDIDLDTITQRLQDEGVAAFVTSFETLMASIAHKRERLQTQDTRGAS